MRKIALAIFIIMLFLLLPPSASAAPEYDLLVDGVHLGTVRLAGDEPGRVLVPVRPVFETMGWKVDFDSRAKTVHLRRGQDFLQLPLNRHSFEKNGKLIPLDFPAVLENNKSYVPLVIFRSAGVCRVNWDGRLQALQIQNH